MSVTDKVHWIFTIPHVLGHQALDLPEILRAPVLEAFAIAQVMVIASRGHRSYTVPELELIFDKGYLKLFSMMERIFQVNEQRISAKK